MNIVRIIGRSTGHLRTRQLVGPLALLLGAALAAEAASAGEIEATAQHTGKPADAGWYPHPLYTQYDNPRMFGDAWLEYPEGTQQYVSPQGRLGSRFLWNRLTLEVECSDPTDSNCVATAPKDGWMSVYSLTDTDDALQGGSLPFTAFGASIGHSWATLHLVKEDVHHTFTSEDSIGARLDPETILVPIHVLVEVPRDMHSSEDVLAMERYADAGLYRAWIDDDFSDPNSQYTSSWPGGGTDNTYYFFSQDPLQEKGNVKIGDLNEKRPDEIWSQCGIQFRLTGVSVLYDDTAALKLAGDLPNGGLGSLLTRISEGRLEPNDELRLLWGVPPVAEKILAIVPKVDGEGSHGLSYSSVAAVSVEDHASDAGNSTASHELGHILGIAGPDDGHPTCGKFPDDHHFMCQYGGGPHHVQGCEKWRDGVVRFLEPEISLEPLNIDLPVGCEPVAEEIGQPGTDLCQVAREQAASFSRSGDLPAQVALLDEEGVAYDSYTANQLRPCGGVLQVTRTVTTQPGDPFPQISKKLSGWTVLYDDPTSNEEERIHYGAEVNTISVDIGLHADWTLIVTFTAKDIQEAMGFGSFQMYPGSDTEAPVLAAVPDLTLAGCASGSAQVIPAPVVATAVTDNCGLATASLTGHIIELNGLALPTPIEVLPEGNVLNEVGQYTVEWIATDAAGNQSAAVRQAVILQACIVAGASLSVQNSAMIIQADGTPMPLMVLGTGQTAIGGGSTVGSVVAKGPVRVDGGATVGGDVTSNAAVQVQAGANVEGIVRQNQNLSFPAPPPIPGTFPTVCSGPKRYNADSGEHLLAPGCYTELQLGSRARLRLEPGTYYFQQATIEPDGILINSADTSFDIKTSFTFRGKLKTATGSAGKLALRFRGTGSVLLESPFSGSVLAPNGTLTMGGTTGQVFRGKYYAKNIDLRAGIQLIVTDQLPSGSNLLSQRALDFDLPLADDGSKGPEAEAAGCSMARSSIGRSSMAQSASKHPSRFLLLSVATLGAVLALRRRRQARLAA